MKSSEYELEKVMKDVAIKKIEQLIEDLKTNSKIEKEQGISYFNTQLFAIRVNEIYKILKGEENGR
jgi:hypothetical protein